MYGNNHILFFLLSNYLVKKVLKYCSNLYDIIRWFSMFWFLQPFSEWFLSLHLSIYFSMAFTQESAQNVIARCGVGAPKNDWIFLLNYILCIISKISHLNDSPFFSLVCGNCLTLWLYFGLFFINDPICIKLNILNHWVCSFLKFLVINYFIMRTLKQT